MILYAVMSVSFRARGLEGEALSEEGMRERDGGREGEREGDREGERERERERENDRMREKE